MILTHPECLWLVSKLLSIKPKQGTLWCRVINHSSREAQHHLLEHLEFCFAFPWSRFEEHYITDHCREVAIKKKKVKVIVVVIKVSKLKTFFETNATFPRLASSWIFPWRARTRATSSNNTMNREQGLKSSLLAGYTRIIPWDFCVAQCAQCFEIWNLLDILRKLRLKRTFTPAPALKNWRSICKKYVTHHLIHVSSTQLCSLSLLLFLIIGLVVISYYMTCCPPFSVCTSRLRVLCDWLLIKMSHPNGSTGLRQEKIKNKRRHEAAIISFYLSWFSVWIDNDTRLWFMFQNRCPLACPSASQSCRWTTSPAL